MGRLGIGSQERITGANSVKEERKGVEGGVGGGSGREDWHLWREGDPTALAMKPQKVWKDNREPRAKSLCKGSHLRWEWPSASTGLSLSTARNSLGRWWPPCEQCILSHLAEGAE